MILTSPHSTSHLRSSRRRPSNWLRILLTLIGASLVSPAVAQPASANKPNVLFISVDDLNDWVGFLGGHPQTRTPNMDRLAARGVVFANAHCAAPLCAPSRAAVFSGREPFRSGVYSNEDSDIRRIAPHLVLLPTHFKAHGYRTLGTGKLLHQKREDLFDEAFTPELRWSPFDPATIDYTAEELPSKATDNPRHLTRVGPKNLEVILPLNRMPSDRRPDDPGAESFDWGPVDVPDETMGDAKIATWAVKHLSAKQPEPFFLAVGFYRPHIPLFAPAKYFEPFPVDTIQLPPISAHDLDDLGPLAQTIARDAVTAGAHDSVLKHNQWKAAVAAYLACIHFVDAQIGRMLDALDAGPNAANTHIILWGDHGWHLGEKQHWGKWTGWERSVRVPLAIVPAARDRAAFASRQSSQQPVSLIDLYPTLMELCGIEPPKGGLDGQSLVPLLRNPAMETGRAVVSTFYGEHYSVRDARWRYLRYSDGSEELYDHATDPHEWRNQANQPEHAAIKVRLARSIPQERVVVKPDPNPKKKRP